jgi:hypothetical protein
VAQLFPWELGSLFVASCDSQGYGGGILTRFHTGPQLEGPGPRILLGLARTVTLGSKSHITHDQILLSYLRLPQLGGPGPRIYIPQEQGGPVIPLGTGFPFRRLLRLSGLRWRYTSTWTWRVPLCLIQRQVTPLMAQCLIKYRVNFVIPSHKFTWSPWKWGNEARFRSGWHLAVDHSVQTVSEASVSS